MSNARADAEEHEALGALHEAAAGVEPERLGPGPLVGDQHRARRDREREDREVGRTGRRGTRRRRRSSSASETRSVTESKNAPRGLAWPLPRAIAPSSRSLTPATITPTTAQTRWPDAMSTAVATEASSPKTVSASAVMPRRRRPVAERAEALLDAVAPASVEHAWSYRFADCSRPRADRGYHRPWKAPGPLLRCRSRCRSPCPPLAPAATPAGGRVGALS